MAPMTLPFASRRGARTALRVGVAVTVLGLAGGCGGSAGTGTAAAPNQPAAANSYPDRIVSVAVLKPGQPVPLPAQKPVLTITGKITVTNKDGSLLLDLRTLDKLGLVQIRLYEPWAKKTLEFRGVWLQDLLAVAGAGATTTQVKLTALDDYEVDLTMADIRRGGILLATRSGEGSTLPIDKGGPTRIVFMDGVKAGANADQWIWSLKSIDVR